MYFAMDGLVNTYVAPSRPLLRLHCALDQFFLALGVLPYLLDKSMASSMLVTAWTSRQLSCTLRRKSDDCLQLYQ